MTYILLLSASQDQASSRVFREFDDRDDLVRVVISHFEDYLETIQQNGIGDTGEDIDLKYTSDELFEFVDQSFAELVCLESQPNDTTDLWIPYSTNWVKESIYLYLRRVAGDSMVPEDEQIREDTDAMANDKEISIVMEVDRVNDIMIY